MKREETQMLVNTVNKLDRLIEQRTRKLETLLSYNKPKKHLFSMNFDYEDLNVQSSTININRDFKWQEIEYSLHVVGEISSKQVQISFTRDNFKNQYFDFKWYLKNETESYMFQNNFIPRPFISGLVRPFILASNPILKAGTELSLAIKPIANNLYAGATSVNYYTLYFSLTGMEK